MARIEITQPREYVFSTDIPIRIGDINRGKHLAHDAVLSIMEEARVRFMRSIGYPEDDMGGVSFITVDVAVIYKKQGFYGQTLRIEIGPADFSRKGCDIVYRISNAATGDEMILAKTGMLFFDYRKQKVASVPDAFRARFDISVAS